MRATRKLLDRISPPTLRDGEQSTTRLGVWYATALSWRPQVALLVNEPTLLPVLMPLAPAATLPPHRAKAVADGRASRASDKIKDALTIGMIALWLVPVVSTERDGSPASGTVDRRQESASSP